MKNFQKNSWNILICTFLISVLGYISADLNADLNHLNARLREVTAQFEEASKYNDEIALKEADLAKQNFKKNAFNIVKLHENRTLRDEFSRRQVELYSQIGDLILPDNDKTKLGNLRSLLRVFQDLEFEKFQQLLFDTDIESSKRDIELQHAWSDMSENLANDVIQATNTYIDVYANLSRTMGFPNTLAFWKYVQGYDNNFNNEELVSLWNSGINKAYKHLNKLLADEFQSIVLLHSEPNTFGKIPAYLYDAIYNIYNQKLDRYFQFSLLYNLLTVKRSYYYRGEDHDIRYVEPTNREFAKKAQSFFASLGFGQLDRFFWINSEFHDTVINPEEIDDIFNYTLHSKIQYFNKTHYIMEINGKRDEETYTRILESLYQIHKNILLDDTALPLIFKEESHSLFQRALAAAIVLLGRSFTHFEEIGLLRPDQLSETLEEDWLKHEAIQVYTTIASAIAVGSWKWDVMANNIPSTNRMCELWNRRYKYENVVPMTVIFPPVDANQLYDVSSKIYTLLNDETDYRNATVLILQFQIIARLCHLAGEYNPDKPSRKPLYTCNIKYGNATVKDMIKKVIKLGSSKTWQQSLDILYGKTGTPLSAKGLFDYFDPLLLPYQDEMKFERDFNFCTRNDSTIPITKDRTKRI